MKKFDIFDLSKTTIVCDRGSNFLKAFQHLYPITCYAHRLNNVLKRSFFQHEKQPSASSSISIEKSCTSDEEDNEPDISPYIPSKPVKTIKKSIVYTRTIEKSVMKTKLIDTPSAVQNLIKTIVDCKSLAKFVKKSGLNKEIQEAGGVALHQAIAIRWLSLINLLESIDTSFTQLKIILHSRKQQQRLCVINQHLVQQMIRLLKPFQSIIKMIQSGSNPTLYLVLPFTLSLRKTLKSFDNFLQHVNKYEGTEVADNFNAYHESECVSYIRERIFELLNSMVDLDVRHYSATLLHPDYRSLRGCSNEEKMECHNYIREQLKLIGKEYSNSNDLTQQQKRIKTEHSFILDEFKDNPNVLDVDEAEDDDNFDTRSIEYSSPAIQPDELMRYLSMKIDMKDYSNNILTFWKLNVNEIPSLARIARRIHSIPATSASVERQFSIAGLTLTNRRTCLNPEQLDNIICIRSMTKINS
ncbi:unnamed protein product [Rotaria sp. Silwood2]|nr:unnamed protein product [Rotaria sp. Silwood2]